MKEKGTLRILDVNLNRFREALRVCEDITRFVIEDKILTAKLKNLRHEVANAISKSRNLKYASLVSSRDVKGDIGRYMPEELNRRDTLDILSANIERAKESARVLEEFSKIIDKGLALKFKKLRFKVYEIEKGLGPPINSG